jgi:hypothetical protein
VKGDAMREITIVYRKGSKTLHVEGDKAMSALCGSKTKLDMSGVTALEFVERIEARGKLRFCKKCLGLVVEE